MNKKPGRNDPCPCGSGKKYKKCCINKEKDKTCLHNDLDKNCREVQIVESEGVYDSLEDVYNSIKKEGMIPVLEAKNEYDFGTYYEVALVCKHAYSEEARTYELRDDGKYEWTESGFNLPCTHCIDNMPPFEMTEEEITDLYKEQIELNDLPMFEEIDQKDMPTFQDLMNDTGKNDPCPCGSGKKYKNCCLQYMQSIETVKNEHVCEFCHKAVNPGVYTNVHLVEGNFCSLECETAMLISVDLFFMGSSAALIPHLRDEHGFTKDEIKVGVDKIFSNGDDVLCGALIDWEDHY